MDLHVFVRVVECGSFTTAADDVGLTPSAVSKAISRLEDRLGARLFHRTTRKLATTPEGELFYVRAKDILIAIQDAEAEVAENREPRGVLRVNCVTGFALHELSSILPDYLALHPSIEVEISVTDRVVDLLEEHADVAIRTGTIVNQSLIARKFSEFGRRLYAAPSYLATRQKPTCPADLVNHDCILQAVRSPQNWAFTIDGTRSDEPIHGRIVVDNAETALRLAIAGGGIAMLADMVARTALGDGRLVTVLDNFQTSPPIPIYAVYPQGRYNNLKTRTFIDFLVKTFEARR